ncbi:uncharacterized protein LOC110844592 [Folsomia candida]|uniref:Muscle M-line assembly protein unc-89 n=1 Tax=Folsomia candida TaxID=158441 RepID=A0A226EQV9_FOLCA|nr:uncharacterized protein LOC110844592 [Folsomia candida]OXA60012.1 Muscle M-line assembly protein unc-89 [Folsomia candida]
MNTFSGLSSLILVLIVGDAWGHNCSNVVEIESQGLLNYLANVSFIAPHNFSGEWVMDMATDVEFTFLGGWSIWISNNPTQGKALFRSRKDDVEIKKGDLVTFRFRISWFKGEPQPEVISLVWDGVEICADNGKTVKDIKASRARRTVNRPPPQVHDMNGRRRYVN